VSTETPDMPVAEGELIAGKYRVERVLGKGGMGVVIAAMHEKLRQRVAIKFLLAEADREHMKRFEREAWASAKLKSEHVARVLDVDKLPNGAPYMVMEYLDGSDLSRVLRKRGALPVEDAVDYLLQACEAIAEAHVAGIVHRDLKPANLFLTTAVDGSASVKVLDFGISKDTTGEVGEEEMALTRTTAVLGSPYYMAPEQMRSSRSVDARADLWSIGVILYQLVTKVVPFKAPTFVELALMVVTEEPKKPTVHKPDLPPALEAAILRCIRKDPAERFANVAELAAAIAPFGRAGAMLSAERIARTQGAPLPVQEHGPVSFLPPAPSAISGSGGSGSGSLGSALSSGPRMLETPSAPTPPPATPPAATSTSAGAVTSPGASTASAVATSSGTALPAASAAPASIPPPAMVSSQTGGTQAATASTWAGKTNAGPRQARRTGERVVVAVGVLLGMLAVAVTIALLRGHTQEASNAPPSPSSGATAEGRAAAAAQDPGPAQVGTARPSGPGQPANQGPGPVEVTAGSAAPVVGAPVSTTSPEAASPRARGGRPPPAPTPAPAPVPAPPTAVAVAPPPPPPAAVPPPASPPPPPAPPPAKKSVLDIDIK
jgi:eukaryotic-like serine/threonine-protein kinase